MASRPYTVFRPGPLTQRDARLWTIDDVVPSIPGQKFPRTMSIVKIGDGTLLFHNAIPVNEDTLEKIQRLGPPARLFVPSPFHCIDAAAFATKLGLRVICPAPMRAAVETRVHVDGEASELNSGEDTLRFEALDGVSSGEGLLVLRSDGKTTLIACDSFFNVPHLAGFWGLVWRLAGFSGPPRVGPLWLRRRVNDRAALRRHFERIADAGPIARIVPSHGNVLETDCNAALRTVAARLT